MTGENISPTNREGERGSVSAKRRQRLSRLERRPKTSRLALVRVGMWRGREKREGYPAQAFGPDTNSKSHYIEDF